MNKRRITKMMVLAIVMFLAFKMYQGVSRPESKSQLAYYPTPTPLSLPGENQEEAYAAAQATLLAGQSEMIGLSQQATLISLNIDQAANAAAQSTMDNNQRQLMELSIRATEVSQNVTRAAATQQSISEQAQMVEDATVTAQSQAATAAYTAYILDVTQTAQVQAMLEVQASQTAQANATRAAFSLTATPWAAVQADIAQTRNQAERLASREEFLTTAFRVALFTLVALSFVVGGAMAYRRFVPVLAFRMRTISRYNRRPLVPADGRLVSPDPHHYRLIDRVRFPRRQPRLPSDDTPKVEIIDPSEPSVTNWIAEAEQKLRTDERIYPNRER